MSYSLGLVRTDRGRRIAIGRDVAAAASTVWTLLTVVSNWEAWGPPVTAVEYPTREIKPDTAGRLNAVGLGWIPFRIEHVGDSEWTWTVWGRTPPADGHRVEPRGRDSCRVVLELPLWAPWYLPVCVVALRTIAREAQRRSAP
jgi:hypothetical protein